MSARVVDAGNDGRPAIVRMGADRGHGAGDRKRRHHRHSRDLADGDGVVAARRLRRSRHHRPRPTPRARPSSPCHRIRAAHRRQSPIASRRPRHGDADRRRGPGSRSRSGWSREGSGRRDACGATGIPARAASRGDAVLRSRTRPRRPRDWCSPSRRIRRAWRARSPPARGPSWRCRAGARPTGSGSRRRGRRGRGHRRRGPAGALRPRKRCPAHEGGPACSAPRWRPTARRWPRAAAATGARARRDRHPRTPRTHRPHLPPAPGSRVRRDGGAWPSAPERWPRGCGRRCRQGRRAHGGASG